MGSEMKMIPTTFLMITLLCVLPPSPVASKNLVKHVKRIQKIIDSIDPDQFGEDCAQIGNEAECRRNTKTCRCIGPLCFTCCRWCGDRCAFRNCNAGRDEEGTKRN